MLTRLITRAPQSAGQKPLICKPRCSGPDSAAVMASIVALITRVKRPRVRMINGKVKSCMTGFISALIKPKTAAMPMIFHHSPTNDMPVISLIAAASESAFMISLKSSCCIDISPLFISIVVNKYSIYIAKEGMKQFITDEPAGFSSSQLSCYS